MLPELLNTFEHVLRRGRYWGGIGIIELKDPATDQFWAKKSTDPMWARIITRSATAKGGLESATAKAAWLDEVGQDSFSLQAWQAVLRRLSLSRGRILGTTTPYSLGWLKQQVVDKKRELGAKVIQFASIMNPAFPIAEFQERQATMQDWRFRMMYMGLFDRPAGLIYRSFVDDYKHRGGHKVRPFVVPAAWPRYVGVDPGGANVGKVWWAHDVEHDHYYQYRESLSGDKTTAQHVKDVLDLATANKENIVAFYVGQKAESQVRRDWQDNGAWNVREPGVDSVEVGIDRVDTLLKAHRLFIFDDCLGTLDEIATYSRELDDNDEPTDKIKNKEKYHRLDAIRYLACGVTGPQPGYVR